MNKRIYSLVSLFLVWYGCSLLISNEIILPSPIDVAGRLVELMGDLTFYKSIWMTFLRAHMAFLISLVVGIGLGLLCFCHPKIEEILSVWIKGLQTIPQISFIIFLYFWFEPQWCIIVVVVLMSFPIVYFNYLEGLRSMPLEYRDLIAMSSHSFYTLTKKVYLPFCRPQLMASIKSALPLSLKVCVMSEVLIYTAIGIGQQLSLAKSAIDMVSVLAWTVAFIGLVSAEMGIINKLFKYLGRNL